MLIQKLTKILFRVIREHLPSIIKSINDNIKKCEEELALLGTPMPADDAGKLSLMWNMLNEFCDIYRNVLGGKYDEKRLSFLKDEGGYRIKILFKNLLEKFTRDYRCTIGYTDTDIDNALTIHEGDSIPGFPSVDAFWFLLRPQLNLLKEPINDCFSNSFGYLDTLASKILEKTFSRFPQMVDDMGEIISRYLNEEKDKCKYLVDAIVESEINYLFTNDYDYIANYSTVQSTEEELKVPGKIGGVVPMDSKSVFINEIRSRIESYFKLIVRNLRDSIPKTIGYNLLRSIQDNMQIKLYNELYKANDLIRSLDEPESVVRQREELTRQIKVMKDAQKVIKRDPE